MMIISIRALIAIAAVLVVAGGWDLKARRDADDAYQKALAEALGELPNPAELAEQPDGEPIKGLVGPECMMIVEPGTEILFELNHPVTPYVNYFKYPEMNYIGYGMWVVPPPPPRDGKWRPREQYGGFCKWRSIAGEPGEGLVWTTDRHILYVAPSNVGMHGSDVLLLSMVNYIYHSHPIAFKLRIMTSGGKEPVEKLMESQGCRIDEVPRDTWWGYGGGIRLRPVYWRKAPPELQWSTGEWIEVDYGDLEEPRAPAEQPDDGSKVRG